MASPAFLAAVVAVFITAGTTVISLVNARQQRETERERHDRQRVDEEIRIEHTLMTSVIVSIGADPCVASIKIAAMLGARMFNGPRAEGMRRLREYLTDECSR